MLTRPVRTAETRTSRVIRRMNRRTDVPPLVCPSTGPGRTGPPIGVRMPTSDRVRSITSVAMDQLWPLSGAFPGWCVHGLDPRLIVCNDRRIMCVHVFVTDLLLT
jgi:hypothetical protein